jgi:hypothetical protein
MMVRLIAKLLTLSILTHSVMCLLNKTAFKLDQILTATKNNPFCTIFLVDVTPEESRILVNECWHACEDPDQKELIKIISTRYLLISLITRKYLEDMILMVALVQALSVQVCCFFRKIC